MNAIHKDIIEATRYFLKLLELGSYSSVKNTIKNKIEILEKYLDLKLIRNLHNRISPTSDGNKIFNDIENTIHNVKQSGFRQRQSIKYSAHHYLSR